MSEGPACIVCEQMIRESQMAPGILPGYPIICRDCHSITPNRHQAAKHWEKRIPYRLKEQQVREAAQSAYEHLIYLERVGSLTREEEPVLEVLKKALEN